MPADPTRFKMFQTGFNKALGGGTAEEDRRNEQNRKAREQSESEAQREHERSREQARRERQGI